MGNHEDRRTGEQGQLPASVPTRDFLEHKHAQTVPDCGLDPDVLVLAVPDAGGVAVLTAIEVLLQVGPESAIDSPPHAASREVPQ